MGLFHRADIGLSDATLLSDGITHTHVEAHHSAGGYPLTVERAMWDIRSFYEYHVYGKGWRDIFYNLLVDPAGHVYEGRGVGNKSHGTALTICFLGNYETVDRPTTAQLNTLRFYCDLHGGRDKLDWHRHRAAGTKYASACPGKLMIPDLERIKRERPTPNTEEPTMSALDDHLSRSIPPGEYDEGSVHWILRNLNHQVLQMAAKQATRDMISDAFAALEIPASRPGQPDGATATLIADRLAAAFEAAAAELEDKSQQ